MIYDRENIQISELCPLQFTEPREYEFYNMQQEYVGKINSQVTVQILVSESIYTEHTTTEELHLVTLDKDDKQLSQTLFSFYELSSGVFYGIATIDIERISEYNNQLCYFKIYSSGTRGLLARSLWYIANPTYNRDLKTISCKHNYNDFNVIFSDEDNLVDLTFYLDVECGFIPKDNRDEQEIDDFIEQDMTNDTVYGDGYKVDPLTIGGSMGIPNWLRNKVFRYFLCDNVTVYNEEVKRTNGAKMEKIEDCENGLATYKIDLQTTNNYLQ